MTDSPSTRPARLADRLAAARRFAGRAPELALFQAALAAAEPPFALLYLYGPGGIGKSTLLQEYARMAAAAGRTVALLDSRNLDPSPPRFGAALGMALGLADPSDWQAALEQAKRPVLCIDTYEVLTPLDGWLREHFLPELPAGSLVVIAGRNPLDAAWRSDLAWRNLTRAVPLRNLRPEESQGYLASRGIAAERHAAILALTHGHPLALSLVADLAGQGDQVFQYEQTPDVIALLLERFVRDVPGPQHRLALYACALARTMTEPLLREALAQPEVSAIFEWLRALSFIEQGPLGLFPHDLARDILSSDLRWRDRERYLELHRCLRHSLAERLRTTSGIEQQRVVFDLVYLHRTSPILRSYYDWQTFGSLYSEPVRPDEHARVLQRIAEFMGEEAAELAQYWIERQPAAWQAIRDAGGQIAGVFMYLQLHETTAEERQRDPAVAYAWDYAQRQMPFRPGDELTLARYYADIRHYQSPTPALNTAQVATGQYWLTNPRLTWAFTDLFDPNHWYGMMSYYDFHRLPNPQLGLYAHNWRATPIAEWLEKVGGRELASDREVDALAAAAAPLLALSQPEFAEAVRAALRDFHTPAALRENALLRARVVRDAAEGTPTAAALQDLLRQGVAAIEAHTRDAKFGHALAATYFTPLTQERAAERLSLPFNTYRYQLAQGLDRLIAWLWQRELYGGE